MSSGDFEAGNYFSHIKRPLNAEFDYRHSTCKLTDPERVDRLVGRVAGRRLTYRVPGAASR